MKAAEKRAQHAEMLKVCFEAWRDPQRVSIWLFSSDMDCAHRIGHWLRETGRRQPIAFRPSRGSTYWVQCGHDIERLVRAPEKQTDQPTWA